MGINLPCWSPTGGTSVTASATAGGTIDPAGIVDVPPCEDQTFTITPDHDYHVTDVLVDGTSFGAVNSYTFMRVCAPHTIAASFEHDDFTAVTSDLPGVSHGAVVWGDYLNDGYLDVLLTGLSDSGPISRIYASVGGTGAFVDIGAGLPGLRTSTGAWGDFDGDSDLDIVLAGDTGSGYVALVFRNDSGVFTDINAALTGVRYGAAAWGDCDGDGDLDLLLMGESAVDRITRVYRNDGAGVFTDNGAGLLGLSQGTIAWGDYDGDGDLDILQTGRRESSLFTRVYRNDGTGVFADSGAGLYPVDWGSAAWGDYDSDGDLDILLTGATSGGAQVTRVYRNDGGAFTDINAGLPGVYRGSGRWGDYDNDGKLDILLVGHAELSNLSRVFRNGGNGVFADIGVDLTGVWNGCAAWGDYDRDGDLDILLAGADDSALKVTTLYGSYNAPANTLPEAPTGLTFQVVGDRLTMNWDASSDVQTPAAGLSYNVRLGLTPGGGEIVPGHSDTASDWRRVVQLGNAQQLRSWTIKLPPLAGPYYWSVQAIDGAYAGGPFAGEQSFSLPTGVEETSVPVAYALKANAPNPFNPVTRIMYSLPQSERVRLTVYDLGGRRVRTLVDGTKPAGNHEVMWGGSSDSGQPIASGVYVCRMEAGSFRETRRMTLVK